MFFGVTRGVQVLYGQQARAVGALLSTADATYTLRRYLRRAEGAVMSEERREALEALLDACREGYLSYESTIARARSKLALV